MQTKKEIKLTETDLKTIYVPVNRYLETGEVDKYLPQIKKVRQKYA